MKFLFTTGVLLLLLHSGYATNSKATKNHKVHHKHVETNVLKIGGRVELRLRIETLVKPAHNAMRDLLIQAANELYNRPWHDPMGYYQITGMHVAPFFPYDGVVNPDLGLWKGGYCNHGNVLFGTW